jgi:hypothetical protein
MSAIAPTNVNDPKRDRAAETTGSARRDQPRILEAARRWSFSFDGWRLAEMPEEYVLC